MMNALTRWNQLRQLEALQHGLGSLFSRSPAQWPEGQEEQIAVPEWAPLVDISEDDKEYLIKAELPEVKREDVKVTAEEGTLTITGERKFEKEEKGRKYHRVERSYGSFVRNFSLPDDASPAKVSAEFKDGGPSVHLTKTQKANSRAWSNGSSNCSPWSFRAISSCSSWAQPKPSFPPPGAWSALRCPRRGNPSTRKPSPLSCAPTSYGKCGEGKVVISCAAT
jgi:HSP20 family protein